MAKKPNEPELPRVEPEIIPPDRGRGPQWPPYGSAQARGTHRVSMIRIGPFGFAILMLALGLLGAVFLLALIGTALIWIPLIAVLGFFALVSRLFRR